MGEMGEGLWWSRRNQPGEREEEQADLERLEEVLGVKEASSVRMSGKGAPWGQGQPVLEPVALAAGTTGWLRMSAQALRCAKTAGAEAAPRCALLWSSANAAGAKRQKAAGPRG